MATQAISNARQTVISAADQQESNCDATLKLIGQIAAQILIPFGAAYFSYLMLPASAVAIVLPIVTICTAFFVSFLFVGQGTFPVVRAEPLSQAAPRGIRNSGMNCWANSLAQTIRYDKCLYNWFLNLPNEWARIEQLPLLTAPITALIAPQDVAMSDALNRIFDNELVSEEYVSQFHPKLQTCIDEQLPNNVAVAKRYYQKYCADFEGSNEEFVQLLLDPEFAQNLYIQDYQKLQTYFECVGEVPDASRYFHFFAEVPIDERIDRWNALAQFCLFLGAYDEAQEENLQQVNFQSQLLREALHELNPSIDARSSVQMDPMEALTAIGDLLTPNDLKVAIESRTTYNFGDHPAMEGGPVIRRRELPQLGYMQLSISEDHPIIREMFAQATDQRNEDPTLRSQQRGVDGVIYDYLIEKEERQFVQPPQTLWLHVKRMRQVQSTAWECLWRMMPSWFSRGFLGLQKVKTPIEAEPQLELQPIEGDPTPYELDGIIIHHGSSLQSGHYTSCQLVETSPGNKAWFEADDRNIRPLTTVQATEFIRQAYAYHYSKIN